jgi:site-specific DNA-methyltransferase (adenine-specific)
MLNSNTIYNDDCLNILKLIDDNSIDLILTDPPYIISRDSGYTNGKLKKYTSHKIDFGEWDKESLDLESLFSEFKRILKPNGTIIWFYDVWKLGEIKDVAERLKFKQPRIGQWVKKNPVPINSKINYLSNAIEFFVSFVKKDKPVFNSEYDNAIYSYPIYHAKDRFHPTQKPIELIKELIRKHSVEGMLILDPFSGSATTAVAAMELNRDWIMIEKNEEYYQKSLLRLDEIKNIKYNP